MNIVNQSGVGVAAPLRLVLSTSGGAVYTKSHLPLRVTFENTSDEAIRLLNHFEPIPVFFSFCMVDDSGNSVAIPGAGKIDFYHDSMQYAELPPGGSLTIDMDLADILACPHDVRPGRFTISVTYHNQYGDRCFRGRVSSEPIEVTLGP